jgi:hypothetical protein
MKKRIIIGLMILAVFCLPEAQAESYNFHGNFSQDDNVQFFTFSVTAPSEVALDTLSYAKGGFLPVLSLWDNAGVSMGEYYPLTGFADVNTTVDFTAGSYTLALTEYNNLPLGDLPNGILDPSQFSQYGNGNFTGPEFSYTPNLPGAFIAPDGTQLTSAWEINLSSTTSTLSSEVAPRFWTQR